MDGGADLPCEQRFSQIFSSKSKMKLFIPLVYVVALACPATFARADGISKVHMVWMNHLDVGYTNNIASVLNIYCTFRAVCAVAVFSQCSAVATNRPTTPSASCFCS